jgi:hypothetical protein
MTVGGVQNFHSGLNDPPPYATGSTWKCPLFIRYTRKNRFAKSRTLSGPLVDERPYVQSF